MYSQSLITYLLLLDMSALHGTIRGRALQFAVPNPGVAMQICNCMCRWKLCKAYDPC